MPPKGWTSGRPEGIVKAVRLSEATIERIARHVERLQAQLSFVRVNEGMAIRNLIDIGLDTAEAGLPQPPTPQQPRETPQQTMSEPAPQLVIHETLTPEPDTPQAPTPAPLLPASVPRTEGSKLPEHITRIAEERGKFQYSRLSLDEFAKHLFDSGIYRRRTKDGQEAPVNKGNLQRWLKRAEQAELL